MIWFACAACKKVHGRPENAAGSMIFCSCGQGVVVPWESTAPAPALPAAAPVAAPVARVEPLSFGGPMGAEPLDALPPPRTSRRAARRPYDPSRCFHHEERPWQKVCEECELSFCEDCTVIFRGQTLCAPCKNYEAKLLQRPPRLSALAVLSMLISFAAGLMVLTAAPWVQSRGFVVTAMIALVLQTGALATGLWAMRATRAHRGLGGQGLAITGVTAALFAAIVTAVVTLYAHKPWA